MAIRFFHLRPALLLKVGGRLLVIALTLNRRGFAEAWRLFALRTLGAAPLGTDVVSLLQCTNGLSRRLRMTCLPRSLALCSLLRERGHSAEVRIGVRHEAGKLLAHAWVELHGEVLGEKLHPDWRLLPMEQAAAVFAKAAAPTS